MKLISEIPVEDLCSNSSLRKPPTFRDATTKLPRKTTSKHRRRNSILMKCHYPDMGSASDWLIQNFPRRATNQKHYSDICNDMSSVWNFCARFSDVISQGNQWWSLQMSAVFSGYSNSNLQTVVHLKRPCKR